MVCDTSRGPAQKKTLQSYTYLYKDICYKSQSRIELIIACSLDLNRGRVLLSINSLDKSFQSIVKSCNIIIYIAVSWIFVLSYHSKSPPKTA